ncbi:MAG: hypothetical protein KIT36_20870 [Alphaproteobacteria bacterium]|nr:hypothetical protein [Alphaproteobacteria bacterium]
MRWIAGLLGGLWRISRASWVDVGEGLRPGSGASALYLFLFLVFLVVAGVLMLLGIDLDAADRWIDSQASWLDLLGSVVLRLVFFLILLACTLTVATGFYQRLPGRGARQPAARGKRNRRQMNDAPQGEGRIGWGAMVLAVILGYFAAIGTFGTY